MAKLTGVQRAERKIRITAAIKAGKSHEAFSREMVGTGLGLRHQASQAEWRKITKGKKKEGLLKYVRKDRIPSPAVIKESTIHYSREFAYKLKVKSRAAPGEPLDERFVTILHDRILKPIEMITEFMEQWGTWYPERRELLEAVIPDTMERRGS